jgi:Zn-dependent M28 family amino/carboxypeptidase
MHYRLRTKLLFLLTAILLIAPTLSGQSHVEPEMTQALHGIRPEALRADLEFLADDALEGRGTGSRGYDLAAKYVRARFQAEGLVSGTKDGKYFQNVALRRTEVEPNASSLAIEAKGKTTNLTYNKDFILMDTHLHTSGSVSAPVVFVGYGVTAPELGYDDYAGIDAKGKIVVVLFFEAPTSFPGTERAYYMDSQTKREIALAHGAVGIVGISTPQIEAKFPWEFMLREARIGYNSMRWLDSAQQPFGLDEQIKATALLSRSGAAVLFAGERHSLQEVFDTASSGKLNPFPLEKTISISYRTQHTRVNSVNVVGIVPGSDPTLRNEYVVFTAHLDHLGIGPAVDGDDIYNGALDNGAGSSILLEVSRFFGSLGVRPRRSVAFVALTGEEQMLLGSEYFARNPPFDGSIVADINVDGGAFFFPVKDVTALGEEHSSLGGIARHAAADTGFELSPDYFPDEGGFVRSDQYSFVETGVPSLYIDLGFKTDKPGIEPLAAMKKWLVTIYHSPKDDTNQPIDYETSARFARFAALLAYYTANDARRPAWNPGDFFGNRFCKENAHCSNAR